MHNEKRGNDAREQQEQTARQRMAETGDESGFPAAANADFSGAANVGFANPGSPTDVMNIVPTPESGGVGAQDPGTGEDLEGEDQGHDRSIVHRTQIDVLERGSADTDQSGGSATSW